MTRFDQIEMAAMNFDAAHPEVWVLFRKFTFERIYQGFQHYSAKNVWERIRWETDKPDHEEGQFKLNNNYTAYYARKFMRMYPEHDGFFRIRKQPSKSRPPMWR